MFRALLTALALVPTLALAEVTPCDQAESLYKWAFEALTEDRARESLLQLEEALLLCPAHPHAPELKRLAEERVKNQAVLAAELERLIPPPPVVVPPGWRGAPTAAPPQGPSVSDVLARAELSLVQSIGGGVIGGVACTVLGAGGCPLQVGAPVVLLGAAAGGVIAWVASDGGISPGQATAVNSGSFWGNAYALALAGSVNLRPELFLLLGNLVGISSGAILAGLRPEAGRVALANSGGIWSAVLTAWTLSIVRMPAGAVAQIGMLTTGAGLVGGAFLFEFVPMTRGRAALIDLGGLIGAVVGGVILPPLLGVSTLRVLPGALGLAGTVAGLSIAAIVTRPVELNGVALQVVPTGPNGSPGVTLGGAF